MIFLAVLLPGVYFIVTGNIIRGIIALILMCSAFFTLFIPGGWIIASIWAVMFRNSKIRKGELKETKKQMDELTAAVQEINKKAKSSEALAEQKITENEMIESQRHGQRHEFDPDTGERITENEMIENPRHEFDPDTGGKTSIL